MRAKDDEKNKKPFIRASSTRDENMQQYQPDDTENSNCYQDDLARTKATTIERDTSSPIPDIYRKNSTSNFKLPFSSSVAFPDRNL